MTHPVPDAVAEVLAVAGQVVDDGPLRQAVTAWSADPWRVAVVGRVAVGKSTLINAVAGRKALKTGLGGVTTAPAEVEHAGTVWIDTPGLDGPYADLGLLPGADAVVWVVDGLQPMTSTEREALAAIPPGMPVHVVVSRADRIDPAEVGSVLERVRALAGPWAPVTVHAVDLRGAERRGHPDLADPGEPAPWMSPRRRRALVEALRGLEAAVASLPPAADRNALADALVTRWRAAVRGVVTPVEEAIRAGRIENRAIAARWLHAAAIPVRDAFVAEAPAAVAPLAPHGPLVLGVPEPISHGPVDVAGGLGGAGAALREIRGIAARWLLDGEVALREWVLAAFHDPGPAAARETLARVIPAALRALDLGVRPA